MSSPRLVSGREPLPPALMVEQAADLLGIGLTTARDLVRRGEWPTPVLRLGRQYRIPTAPLLDLLGLSGNDAAAGARDTAEHHLVDATHPAPTNRVTT